MNGSGFILSNSEAARLIEADQANEQVVRQYLTGQDLVTSPQQKASRFIVNFENLTMDAASRFRLPFDLVRERVKPVRDTLPDYKRRVRDGWWQYEFTARELYGRVAALERCLGISRVGKAVMPVFTTTDVTFSDAVVVFAYDDDFHFGVLSSAFHWWWTVKYASTMRADIRYTPTDVFETFPQPEFTGPVREAGRALDAHRHDLIARRDEGVTRIYNRFHEPAEQAVDIQELRRLHVALDTAVADAYGWRDLDLDHGFHETRLGMRFTVGPQAQAEILDRLLELNHARYAREQSEQATGAKPVRKRARSAPGQTSMLGEG